MRTASRTTTIVTAVLLLFIVCVNSQVVRNVTENTVSVGDLVVNMNFTQAAFAIRDPREAEVLDEYFEYGTGVVTIRKNIDREDIASRIRSGVGNTFQPVTLSITYVSGPTTASLDLNILDQNDNVPLFPTESAVVEIAEANAEAAVTLTQATDLDEGSNSIRNYSLIDDLDGLFAVSVRYNDLTQAISEVRLEVTRPLDRETVSRYSVQLLAIEGSENPRTAVRTLNVTVKDVCDRSPTFPTTRYFPPSIPEDSPVNTVIFNNITAYDEDLVDQMRSLTYTIYEVCRRPEEPDPCQIIQEPYPFVLDSEGGLLTLNDELDREDYAVYEVSVHATDRCNMMNSATVVVTVEDVNDNAPIISPFFEDRTILESININTTVGFFTIEDRDSGDNGNTSHQLYELVNEQLVASHTFQLVAGDAHLKLKLIQRVDREVRSEYLIVLLANDFGNPQQTARSEVLLTVEDLNDNSPIINRDNIQSVFEIDEELVANTLIVTIEATDADDVATGNGRVTYHLPPSNQAYPYQHLFEMETETGVLKIAGRLDREVQDNIILLVVASDNPTNNRDTARTDTATVSISLRDVNDNMPVINFPQGVFEVSENFIINTELFTVIATDDDTSVYATLTYGFTVTPDDNRFLYDESSVFLRAVPFDYEATSMYSFVISVSDGEFTTQEVLNISVINTNDENPVFELLSRSVVVNIGEGNLVGYHVTTINVTDPDGMDDNIRLLIASGNERDHFEIDAISGRIRTTTSLDKEDVANYTLIVRAFDGLLYTDQDAVVSVNVLDVNDNEPQFFGAPYHFQVNEGNSIGTIVRGASPVQEIEASDLDTGENSRITFSIDEAEPTVAGDWFLIDEISGRITTKTVIDRESSDLGESGTVRLIVRARNPRIGDARVLSNLVDVTITIRDISDQSPIFAEDNITISLAENLEIGTAFLTVHAVDLDLDPYNQTLYSIVELTPSIVNRFHIDETTGTITLAGTLDHETEQEVRFTVRATDGFVSIHYDLLAIIINVTDAQDPCLKLKDFIPAKDLPEHSPLNTLILSFEATNLEGDTVSTVVYDLTNGDGTPSMEFAISEVNHVANIHTTTMNIDREALIGQDNPQAVYTLAITAHDSTDSPLECVTISSVLTVTVTDINDNAPTFMSDVYNFSITENTPSNTLAGSVVARDTDQGANSEISYRIIDANIPFTITGNGEIRSTTNQLNRDPPEGTAVYTFTVRAQDNGNTPKSSSASVSIYLTDENDNTPVFNRNQNRTFYIPEDHPVNAKIATIAVSDSDAGDFGSVSISVNQGSSIDQHFQLFSNGDIFLMLPLDRETRSQYSFEARARDGGGRSDTAVINIVVTDVNDNTPIFGLDPVRKTIREDAMPGDGNIIFTVTATDADEGANANVKFELADASLQHIFCNLQNTGQFYICPISHNSVCLDPVSNMQPPAIDFERNQSYDLTILAYEEAGPRHFTTKPITIEIEDVNEHSPNFDSRGLVSVVVGEELEIGADVLRIRAYDMDSLNDPMKITYTVMENGQTSANFGYRSGAIVTSTRLDFNSRHRYELDLRAQELIDETKHSNVMVFVYVRNVNDRQPVFDTTRYLTSTEILETIDPNTVVLTVQANDADNATHDAVYYEIVDGNIGEAFTIDSQTGDVIVTSHLDYDSVQSYTLSVVAKDTGEPQLTSTALELSITIGNVNDESPIFTRNQYEFNFTENSRVGTSIGEVDAPDRDLGDFGTVTYSLIDGQDGYFDVDSSTGDVLSLVEIDRETAAFSTRTFQVMASDGGQPPLSSVTQVTVTIVDADDNSPLFSRYQYFVHGTAQSTPNTRLFNLEGDVTDQDIGGNAEFRFEIASQITGDLIAISPSGDVMLRAGLPSSPLPLYEAQVIVYSALSNSLFDTAIIRLVIEGSNDRHPMFDQHGYSTEVSEDLQIGDLIFDFSGRASDPDLGPNGELTFQFQETNPLFAITNEVITLAMSLDFEQDQMHTLRVAVVDGSGRTAETLLTITVLNTNDESPEFEDLPERFVLSTIPRADIDLFTVTARDGDEGQDGVVRYIILTSDNTTSVHFTIDHEYGIVRSKAHIPAGTTINLKVTAYDLGSPPLAMDAFIEVAFQNPNPAPVFAGIATAPYTIDVEENRGVGTIYTFGTQSQNSLFRLVYTDSPEGLFSISKSQGVLHLQGKLDFLDRSNYRLYIEAYIEDSTNLNNIVRNSAYLEVIINVIDVNNNDPVFVRAFESVELVEDASGGMSVFTAQAFDDDSGTFGQLNYEIRNGNPDRAFAINRTSGQVTLDRTLDRELYSSYDLVIRAFDLSSQPNFGEMILHIQVADVNDNPPSFILDGNYSIGVYEYPHTQGGARIIRVSAVDPDTGPPLRYQLFMVEASLRGEVTTNPPQTNFEIDIDSGMVSLSSSTQLDYELLDYYLLRVAASDSESITSTYLTINVMDVNENAPVVNIPTDFKIWELQPVNSFVTRINSTDADLGLNGVVTYSLDEHSEGLENLENDNFVIDPHTGVIRNKRVIVAAHRTPLHTLTVNATDQGNPPLVTSMTFSFRSLDINNNPPVFNTESYVFGISVNANAGGTVGQFSASDADYGENSGIRFAIPHYYSEANGLFQLVRDSNSDEDSLTLKNTVGTSWNLQAQNYTFRLEAANVSPNPSCAQHYLATYADITVVVYPECPTFEYNNYNVLVSEDETVLSGEILTATSLVGRQVEYFINETMDMPFTVERSTGRLMIVNGLDRETKSEYVFRVIATDSILQPTTCSVTVIVTILDVNDNSPVFSSDTYSLSTMENTLVDSSVGQVRATDIDVGENSNIEYELYDQLAELPFRIERTSGEIITDGELDAETVDTYTFMVVAIDNGSTRRSSTASVTVTIGDINEGTPTFTVDKFDFNPIGPNRVPGDVIAQVTAQDFDKRSELTFSFINDPPKIYFRINRITGEIILNVSSSENNSPSSKRSIHKRQAESDVSQYFTVSTEVEVSDGVNSAMTSFDLSLHNSFKIATTAPTGDTLIIIVVVVASVVAVIIIFFLLLFCACMCRYRRTSKKVQIKDSAPPNNSLELGERFQSRRSQGSRSSTPGQLKLQSTKMYPMGHALRHSSGSRSNSSEQSYSNYADDELDSNNEMMARSAYNSPGLQKRPPNNSAHARSTSDLASSIGTDMLGSQQLPHPKAKIAAIYAAHHGLLNNHGSRESIHSNHTFASEGGGEADAEADIDNVLYRKYDFDDDDEDLDDETTIPDDSSYMGNDPALNNSVGNLNVPPVEEDIPHYGGYSQPGMGEWVPRTTPMEHAINELSEMASYSSSQEHHAPGVPRYLEHSQPVSMYGASSQGSHISLLPHRHRPQQQLQHPPPRHYDLPPQMEQPMQHEYEYYGPPPPPQEPLRHHVRTQPRYSSASALQEYHMGAPRDSYTPRGNHRIDPRMNQPRGHTHHMMLSQDVPPTYLQQGHYIPRGVNRQTPSSDTPTDGTVTPHRAMTQEYDHQEYMSSSSTSLGSTNLSGTTSSIGASISQRIYK